LDNQPTRHFRNDLTVDARGDVFISDSLGHEVYTIDVGRDRLEVFLSHEWLQTPNGIDLSPDGKRLFVSVPGGALVIRTDTKEATLAAVPNDQPFWADGLYFYRDSLIAVGPREGRPAVTRYFLNADLDHIDGYRIIDEGNPAFGQPTTGALVGDELYFIANSQLQLFRRCFWQTTEPGWISCATSWC
jgi:hypothetical protein